MLAELRCFLGLLLVLFFVRVAALESLYAPKRRQPAGLGIGAQTFVGLVFTLCVTQHWSSALLEVKSDGNWRPRKDLDHRGETAMWELDAEFKEVLWTILRRSQLKHVRNGLWHLDEDISMLEARATVSNMRRLARTQQGGSIRQLSVRQSWASGLLLNAVDLATLEF